MDCVALKVSSSSRPECTCLVGGAEESDAGSMREEVRSQLANVVLPGHRLRRCGSSSIETGDEDCGKGETADHCTGQHRLRSDNGIGPRAATFPCLEDRGWSSRSSPRGLKGSQAWSNGEDWPPCTTRWPPDAVQATAGKTFHRQKLLSWKTFLTLFKHGKTLNKDIKSATETSCPRI